MPTNRKRRARHLQAVGGLSESAYEFFGNGPFFAGEDYERETTEAERSATWKTHKAAIIARWRRENPQHHDIRTWGETLEKKEAAEDAHE